MISHKLVFLLKRITHENDVIFTFEMKSVVIFKTWQKRSSSTDCFLTFLVRCYCICEWLWCESKNKWLIYWRKT